MTPIEEWSWKELLTALDRAAAGVSKHPREIWREIRRRVHLASSLQLRGARGFSDEDRQDLTQEILLKLQDPTVLLRAQKSGNPGGYLHVMLRNAAYDLLRRRSLEKEILAGFDPWPSPLLEVQGHDREELAERLGEEIERLSPTERRLIDLRFMEDRKIREIADEMGLQYSATAVRLHRLTKKLATCLQNSGREV